MRVPAEALSHLGESELDDAFVGAPGRERRVGENRWQYHIVPAEGDFEQRDDFVTVRPPARARLNATWKWWRPLPGGVSKLDPDRR